MVQLSSNSGDVTKTYDYDAFGNENNTDENDTNPYRYCGEYFDRETATVYLRARYYDPEIGRFVTEDSYKGEADDPLSLNLYTYCNNNPVIYFDATGNMPVKELRRLSYHYNMGIVENDNTIAAAAISKNGRNIWLAFHEIAQLGVAKELHREGYDTTLEYGITSNVNGKIKHCEADVVAGREIWEVKPLVGQDPKGQLDLYQRLGGLKRGHTMRSIDDIKIAKNVYMRIDFPKSGYALYSFYKKEKGKEIRVSTVYAYKTAEKEKKQIEESRRLFETLIHLPNLVRNPGKSYYTYITQLDYTPSLGKI